MLSHVACSKSVFGRDTKDTEEFSLRAFRRVKKIPPYLLYRATLHYLYAACTQTIFNSEPIGELIPCVINSEPLGELINLFVLSEPLGELRTNISKND